MCMCPVVRVRDVTAAHLRDDADERERAEDTGRDRADAEELAVALLARRVERKRLANHVGQERRKRRHGAICGKAPLSAQSLR